MNLILTPHLECLQHFVLPHKCRLDSPSASQKPKSQPPPTPSLNPTVRHVTTQSLPPGNHFLVPAQHLPGMLTGVNGTSHSNLNPSDLIIHPASKTSLMVFFWGVSFVRNPNKKKKSNSTFTEGYLPLHPQPSLPSHSHPHRYAVALIRSYHQPPLSFHHPKSLLAV